MNEKRQNIGLLVSELENEFTHSLCEGAIIAARELHANLFIFPGKYLRLDHRDTDRNKYEYQDNILFSYAQKQELDVLLVDMGTIGTNLSDQEKTDFLSRFTCPVITIASKIQGYSSIRFNNEVGFRDGITHLIKEHGCKRIGLVSGPVTSDNAMELLDIYRTVLEENDISYDDRRVVHGDFFECSQEAVSSLLDNNPDLDAVVFANDGMAIGGYKVFLERNIKIGQDISVMGFDDMPCAVHVTPNLTTVKADAAELGYHAVVIYRDMLNCEEKDVLIDSVFIPRESCGCMDKGFERLHIMPENLLSPQQLDLILEDLNFFLFGRSNHQHGTAKLKEAVAEYIIFLRDKIIRETGGQKDWDGLRACMKKISNMKLSPYTDIAKIFFLFDCMFDMLKQTVTDQAEALSLSETYIKYYRQIAKDENQIVESGKTGMDWLNRIATTFNRDILNYPIGDDRAYYSIADKILQLYYKSFYLCLFEKPVRCAEGERVMPEEEVLVKAYVKDGEAQCPLADRQHYQVQGLLKRLYSDDERDEEAIVILSVLYSADEQYGLLIHENPEHFMNYITPINAQISSAISTLELLKNQDSIKQQLEESLAKIKESNAILDELSKSDELTNIYNRRGFLTTVQYQIANPKNEARRAVVIFADMNNLKIVNDRFGHEEGDYSLKMIAAILKEALPDGIVGRFGGDEFAGFGLMEDGEKVTQVRERIKRITQEHNDGNEKPYYVSMSVGVCELTCGKNAVLKDLLDQADVDLYLEKKHKRNNILKN